MSGPVGGFRSELGRVRGLGSAREGVQHWWAQRVSALLLVPLTVWFVISIVVLAGADHVAVSTWLAAPPTVGLMALLIAATFHHAQLGLQVVIEDYVHREATRLAAILLVKLASLALGLAAILALLVNAFGD